MTTLAIIGGGSWGTALACVLSPRFERVHLRVKEPDLAARMRQSRVNDIFLPGIPIPANVQVETSFEPALADAEVVIGVMPSHVVRDMYAQMLPWLKPRMRIVSASKGLESGTLLRMSQVIRSVVGPEYQIAA